MNDQLPQQYAEPVQPMQSTSSLVLDPQTMQSMMAMAEFMAKAASMVPVHFRGKPGDCLAVVMQAMQWGMNPYAIAQKTHLVQGTLGYEAQLVNAVIIARAPVKGRLQYEWFGKWERIIGKFVEKTSTKKKDEAGDPATYRAPNWKIEEEDGLGVKVWGTFKGEESPRELVLLLTQARVRNSSLWADDPKQQLAYLATKKWSRLYCPDVIMGVYTPDEIEEMPIQSGMDRATAEDKKQAIDPNAEKRAELVKLLEAAAATGGRELQTAFRALTTEERSILTVPEWERIKKLVVPTKTVEPETATEQKKLPTYAEIMESIKAETSVDILGAIANSITHLPEDQQRELVAAITKKVAQFSGGEE